MTKHLLLLALAAVVAVAPARAQPGPTPADAVAMVKRAVKAIKRDGAAKVYPRIDDRTGPFADRDLYVVVTSMEGKVLATGANSHIVGKTMLDLRDIDGKPFVRERVELAKTKPSFWQTYQYMRPESGRIEPKRMYCERLQETVVCSGIYN